MPQVLTGPSRTNTSDFLSATLAEATTQLSFAEFLECCILLRGSPPAPLPISTLLSQMRPPARSLGGLGSTLYPRCSLPHVLPTRPSATPRRGCADDFTQCGIPRCLQTTTAHGVLSRVYSKDPLDRQASPSAHCNAGSASPPQPADIATLCSPSSASHASDGHEDTTAPRVSPQPPPGLGKYARQYASHGETCQNGTRATSSVYIHLRNAPAATCQYHPSGNSQSCWCRPSSRNRPFPKPRALVLPMVKFGQSKPDGLGYIDTVDSDLMHHQYRLSVLQWNPGPARRNPTNIFSASCGRFHAVILHEASDHVLHISDQFTAHTGNTDLAILINKDTFEPDPVVLAFTEDSTSKGTWGMVLLIVRAPLRRPLLSGTPTVTFCSVHIQNLVAKKSDASTVQHNVDFVRGDFNMSAFSTVGEVFSDPEFSAPGR